MAKMAELDAFLRCECGALYAFLEEKGKVCLRCDELAIFLRLKNTTPNRKLLEKTTEVQ